ncbi:MAG: hypothetical protein ABI921_03815 [Panacibacter sp.]
MADFKSTDAELVSSLKKFFLTPPTGRLATKSAGKPILDATWPRKGIAAFKHLLVHLGIDSTLNGFSLSVSFSRIELGKWLNDPPYKVFDHADEIKVCFGLYTDDFLGEPDFEPTNLGRITVFLMPFHLGKPAEYSDASGPSPAPAVQKPIPAFDLGGLEP